MNIFVSHDSLGDISSSHQKRTSEKTSLPPVESKLQLAEEVSQCTIYHKVSQQRYTYTRETNAREQNIPIINKPEKLWWQMHDGRQSPKDIMVDGMGSCGTVSLELNIQEQCCSLFPNSCLCCNGEDVKAVYLELWLDTNALHDATVEISSNRMTALKTHSFLLIRGTSKQQLATLVQGDTAVGVWRSRISHIPDRESQILDRKPHILDRELHTRQDAWCVTSAWSN